MRYCGRCPAGAGGAASVPNAVSHRVFQWLAQGQRARSCKHGSPRGSRGQGEDGVAPQATLFAAQGWDGAEQITRHRDEPKQTRDTEDVPP